MNTTAKRQRGERAGITRDQVLDAAIHLVDQVGLTGLTMRALGRELGVEAMTLYHYVPNKEALVDGIVERVFVEAARRDGGPRDNWGTELRRYANKLRQGLLAHPGILPAAMRPASTPAALEAVEVALRYLTDAGFRLGMALDMINSLTLFVIGHTVAEVGIDAGDGAGSAAWMRETLTEERLPLIMQAAREGRGTSDAARFEFAVNCLIDGFRVARDESVGMQDVRHPVQ